MVKFQESNGMYYLRTVHRTWLQYLVCRAVCVGEQVKAAKSHWHWRAVRELTLRRALLFKAPLICAALRTASCGAPSTGMT